MNRLLPWHLEGMDRHVLYMKLLQIATNTHCLNGDLGQFETGARAHTASMHADQSCAL